MEVASLGSSTRQELFVVKCKEAVVAAQKIYNNCNYDNVKQWTGQYMVDGSVIEVFAPPQVGWSWRSEEEDDESNH